MAEVSEFHINKDYQELIPPLTTQEYSELKESIKNNGQRISISLSDRTGQPVIIDGHHRYKACKELGIEPKYITKHFENEAEEIGFIRDCNSKRRHLNPFQRGVIELKAKHILSEIARKNQSIAGECYGWGKSRTSSSKHLEQLAKLPEKGVNEILGKSAGSSHETIRKIEKIMKEAPQHIIDKAMKGQYSINKAFKHLQNEQRRQELLNTKPVIRLPENTNYKLMLGDLLEKGKEIPANSIDLILTDPPYDEASLQKFRDLGVFSNRVLKEGGSLVTLAGHYALLRTGNYIEESGLKYVHIMSLIHGGGCSMLYAYHIRVQWKPILWFVKGTKPNTTNIIDDIIFSEPPDKALHEWAQSPVEAEHVINGLTVGENQIVLDPFMGAGTFGTAALKLNRKFIGIEIDPERFKVAEANISKAIEG